MITIDTLLKLIEVRQELIKTAEKFGYGDLRFFCVYTDDQRHTLNIIGTYRRGTRDDATVGEDIDETLGKLLNTPVLFLEEGSLGFDKYYLKEGYNVSLSDMDKTIEYFIDEIIPRSTDKEPEEEDRIQAQKKWEEHKREQEDPLQGWKRKRDKSDEAQPDYAEILAKKTTDGQQQQNLPPETIRTVDEVLQKLGNNRQQWDALEAYIHAKRGILSNVPTPSSK